MTNKQIGGRGKKAPYETTHVRIPVDLKYQIELLVEDYRNNHYKIAENNDRRSINNLSSDSDNFIQLMIEKFKQNNLFIVDTSNDASNNKNEVVLQEAINIANEILVNTRVKKEAISKLLTALYKIEVKL
jgi:hypothetical protein